MQIEIPYGKTTLTCDLPDSRVRGVLHPKTHTFKTGLEERDVVLDALAAPVQSPPLAELVQGKKRIVLITSDHTRPVPSRVTMPLLLNEIRKGNPNADVTILIATGCHRRTSEDELRARFGADIYENEKIKIHDAGDETNLLIVGRLPSGGELRLNRIAMEADLLLAEGFIEPHFFAGFSGGRKSVLPGIAGYEGVLANHCAEFIADENARTGVLDGNPIHTDMMYAVGAARLAFILNVVLDSNKKIAAAFAGHPDAAHRKGCRFLRELAVVDRLPADIVITGNGGYPLDQNLYQAVKCMTAAEATLLPEGVVIAAAEAADGHGGESFFNAFAEGGSPEEVMSAICARGRGETLPDQWQIQIFARVLLKHKVIMVTSAPSEMVEHLRMLYAPSLEEAVRMAEGLLGKRNASITVVPDGVSVIVGGAFSA